MSTVLTVDLLKLHALTDALPQNSLRSHHLDELDWESGWTNKMTENNLYSQDIT